MVSEMVSLERRQYQHDDALRIVGVLWGSRAVLYVLPTGGGKTVVVVNLITALKGQQRVLIISHRREIVDQTRKRLVASGARVEDIGIIMPQFDQEWLRPSAPVQVASIQTLARRKKLPKADLVIIDEAHHATAETYRQIVKAYPKARILGMTATPERMDGRGLGDLFESMVVGPTIGQLIADGHLAAPDVFSVPDGLQPKMQGVEVRNGDFVRAQSSAKMRRRALVGSIPEHWLKHAEGRRTVCYCVDVKHAQDVMAGLKRAGIRAELLTGETPRAEREEMIAPGGRLDRGETQVVVNCEVLTEGWDLPSVKCAIIARPTRSLGLYLQMAGRILRPWRGVTPIVLDHAGNALRFGLPQQAREWSLASRARASGVARYKHCPGCDAVVALITQACSCGFIFWEGGPPASVTGQLRKLEMDTWHISMTEEEWTSKTDMQIAREKGLSVGSVHYRRPDNIPSPDVAIKQARRVCSKTITRKQWSTKTNAQISREKGIPYSLVAKCRPPSIPSPKKKALYVSISEKEWREKTDIQIANEHGLTNERVGKMRPQNITSPGKTSEHRRNRMSNQSALTKRKISDGVARYRASLSSDQKSELARKTWDARRKKINPQE